MRFIYLTTKQYPGSTADHHYIEKLAYALHRKLGEKFLFVASNTNASALLGLPLLNIRRLRFIKRTTILFFWIPWYWYRHRSKDTTFFSNDFNALLLLIFWKKVLFLSYNIVSDWHLMTESWKDRIIARESSLCLTTSKTLKEAILALDARAHCKEIYGGVDLEAYETNMSRPALKAALGLPLYGYLVGYIGLFTTMGMEKGISTMIDALQFLDKNVQMVFVGGKEAEIDRYRAYAEVKGAAERCFFVPVQPFPSVVKYEQAMDVLSIPYPNQPHFRNYGFPMKVYEYMASKTPIVYTTLPLAHEVLSDCAFGVVPDSPRAFAETIQYLHLHPEEAHSRAELAREKVQQYTWAKKAENIIKCIETLHS